MRYRKRIKDEFADGDVVVITLKNRAIEQGPDEEDWYEKAFGPKQNIMVVRISFQPETKEHLKRNKNDIYADVVYEMFEEIEGEFDKNDYEVNQRMKLDPVEYDKDLYYFEKRFELPYGSVNATLKVAGKPTDTGELNLTPLPEGEKFEIRIDPEPKSLKQLREEHEIEE